MLVRAAIHLSDDLGHCIVSSAGSFIYIDINVFVKYLYIQNFSLRREVLLVVAMRRGQRQYMIFFLIIKVNNLDLLEL